MLIVVIKNQLEVELKVNARAGAGRGIGAPQCCYILRPHAFLPPQELFYAVFIRRSRVRIKQFAAYRFCIVVYAKRESEAVVQGQPVF
jgi:hypothetical protein